MAFNKSPILRVSQSACGWLINFFLLTSCRLAHRKWLVNLQASAETTKSHLKRALRSPSASPSQVKIVRTLANRRLVIPCVAPEVASQARAAHQAQTQRHQSSRQHNLNYNHNYQPSLLLWHKDERLDAPIFVVDTEGKPVALREAKQQTLADWLKDRARLEMVAVGSQSGVRPEVPALVIEQSRQSDSGLYTCTIEFPKAPTQTHQTRVSVLEPASNIVVRDHSNLALTPVGLQKTGSQQFGPFNEGTRLVLSCEADSGWPHSQLSWWRLESVQRLAGPEVPARILSSSVEPESADRLTTVMLAEPAAQVDQLVSFASHDPAPHQSKAGPSTTGGAQLRHWKRVTLSTHLGDQQAAHLNISPAPIEQSTFQLSKLSASIEIELERSHFDQQFLCLAHSNQMESLGALPLNLSVQLDLNLKPTEVKIVNKPNLHFRLGEQITVECQVFGARPVAQVRWLRSGEQLQLTANDRKQQQQQGLLNNSDANQSASVLTRDLATSLGVRNGIESSSRSAANGGHLSTLSYLTFIPRLSDDQSQLTCSADNPQMPGHLSGPLSDSLIMNVQYKAQLELKFGANIKPDSIRLGWGVFMDCEVKANPTIDELTWYFNDQPLNLSAGIIVTNQTIALQHVSLDQRGHYQCSARNALGRSFSNKLYLRPKFAPVCNNSPTKSRYELSLNQERRIECNVMAEPADDIVFSWTLNRTHQSGSSRQANSQTGRGVSRNTETLAEPLKQFETNFTRSHLMFTAKSESDFGQIFCRASNLIGEQAEPCLITIVQSELPDPVFGCFSSEESNSSFSINCQNGSSPSGRVSYLLELFDMSTEVDSDTGSIFGNSETDLPQEPSSGQQSQQPEAASRAGNLNDEPDMSRQNNKERNSKHHQRAGLSDEQSDPDLPNKRYKQVRSAVSEEPAFKLANLKPGTRYYAMVYVQNSKGRSMGTSYLTETLPSSGTDSRIEIRPSAIPSSTKGLGYLGMNDYMNFRDRSSRPMVAVAMMVVLCTITIIILTCFVKRACRRSTTGSSSSVAPADRSAARPEVTPRHLESSQDFPEDNRLKTKRPLKFVAPSTKLARYDKRQPAIESDVRLTPVSSILLKSPHLAGSGSDTSRETNTESTLVTSSRTGADTINSGSMQTQVDRHSSSPYILHPQSQSQPQSHGQVAGHLQTGPNCLYAAIRRSNLSSPFEQQSSGSDAQMSIQQQQPDHLIVKCPGDYGDPIYVISGTQPIEGHPNELMHRRQQIIGQSPQIRVTDSANQWSYCNQLDFSGSLSGETQQSGNNTITTNSADSSDRTMLHNVTLVNNDEAMLVSDLARMSNSISIPVAMDESLGRPTNFRRYSQEQLVQDCFGHHLEPSVMLMGYDDSGRLHTSQVGLRDAARQFGVKQNKVQFATDPRQGFSEGQTDYSTCDNHRNHSRQGYDQTRFRLTTRRSSFNGLQR